MQSSHLYQITLNDENGKALNSRHSLLSPVAPRFSGATLRGLRETWQMLQLDVTSLEVISYSICVHVYARGASSFMYGI